MSFHTHIISKEEFLAFSAAWRALAAARKTTASDQLLHAILNGKNPLRAFAPVTNSTKLANGQSAHASLWHAFEALQRPAYPGIHLKRTQHLVQLSEASLVKLKARLDQVSAELRQGAAR